MTANSDLKAFLQREAGIRKEALKLSWRVSSCSVHTELRRMRVRKRLWKRRGDRRRSFCILLWTLLIIWTHDDPKVTIECPWMTLDFPFNTVLFGRNLSHINMQIAIVCPGCLYLILKLPHIPELPGFQVKTNLAWKTLLSSVAFATSSLLCGPQRL
jgi:hypothetical protein